MVSTPRKIGTILAIIHLAVAILFAVWIYGANAHDGESPMYWLFLMLIDLPAFFLLKPLSYLVEGWPRVDWLPGLAGGLAQLSLSVPLPYRHRNALVVLPWLVMRAHVDYYSSTSMTFPRQPSNQAMQRTAGRSAFPLAMTSTFSQQPCALSPAVADLVSR